MGGFGGSQSFASASAGASSNSFGRRLLQQASPGASKAVATAASNNGQPAEAKAVATSANTNGQPTATQAVATATSTSGSGPMPAFNSQPFMMPFPNSNAFGCGGGGFGCGKK
jgi:hypothetical protein